MGLKITSGQFSTLVAGVGAGLMGVFPSERWIGAAMIVASIGFFIWDVRVDNRGVGHGPLVPTRTYLKSVLPTAGKIVFVALLAWAVVEVGRLTWLVWTMPKLDISKALVSHSDSYPIGTFAPPDWAKKNDDGSERLFIHEKPLDMVAHMKGFTTQQSTAASQVYIGKWLAVTGVVQDVYEPRGQFIPVRLGFDIGNNLALVTIFPITESAHLSVFKPGDPIKAVCKVFSVESQGVTLEDCRVVS